MTSKYVLITGANSGIGLATSLNLAKCGYIVIAALYKDLSCAEELFGSSNGKILPIVIDVQDSVSIENAFEQVAQIVGESGLTAVINCAGIALLMPCEAITTEEVKAIINTNLTGTFLVSQASLPLLRKAKGTLINIASDGGYLAMPFGSAYCASKFGVEALSDSLRVEVKPQGVNVVILEPGNIDTPIWTSFTRRLSQRYDELSPPLKELYQQDFANLKNIAPAGLQASKVAYKIQKIIESPKKKARYIIGSDAYITKFISILPSSLRDLLTRKVIESYASKNAI